MTVVLVIAAPLLLASFALQMEKLESRVLLTGGQLNDQYLGKPMEYCDKFPSR